MKLYYEDKLKIIEMYKQGVPQRTIAMKFNTELTTIKRVLRFYREYGLEALKDKKKNTKYTPEFKFSMVKRVLSGESIRSIGVEYLINEGTIYSWCKKYNELGYNGLKQDLRGRSMSKKPKTAISSKPVTKEDEIKRLEEENEQLKMELDLLKKLNALVRQRKERQNKKK